MKKTATLLICLISTFISFAQPGNDLIKHLPGSSAMVFSFNFDNILEKVEMDRVKEMDVFKDSYVGMKKEAKDDSVIVKKIWKNPKSYGVDMTASVEMFIEFESVKSQYSENEYQKPVFGILIPLKSARKFEKLLVKLLKEQYEDFVGRTDSYSYYYKREIGIAWSKKTLLLLFVDGEDDLLLTSKLDYIMNLNKNKSLLVNNEFQDYMKIKNDISCFVQPKLLVESIRKNMAQEEFNPYFDMDFISTSLLYELNFDNAELNIQAKQLADEKSKSIIEAIKSTKISPYLTELIDQNAMVVYSQALDIEEMKSVYMKEYPIMADSLEDMAYKLVAKSKAEQDSLVQQLQEMKWADTVDWDERQVIREQIDERIDSLTLVYKEDVSHQLDSTLNVYSLERDEIWSIFKGDFVFTINGAYESVDTFMTYEYGEDEDGEFKYMEVEKTKTINLPLFRGMVLVNLPDIVNMAMDSLVNRGLIVKNENYFSYIYSDQVLYMGMNQHNVLTFTNEESFMKSFVSNTYNAKPNTRMVKLANENAYMLQADIRKLAETFVEENDRQISDLFTNYVDELLWKIWIDTTFNAKFAMVSSKKQNSLYSLLEAINDAYLKFGKRK